MEHWYSLRDSIDYNLLLRRAPAPNAVFGDGSTVNPDLTGLPATADVPAFPASWQFIVYLLLILFFYSGVIFRYRTPVKELFKSAFSLQKTLNFYEMQSNDMAALLRYGVILIMLSVAAIISDTVLRLGTVDPRQAYIAVGAALALTAAIAVFRAAAIGAMRMMSDSGEVCKRLRFLNRHFMTAAGITITPLIVTAGLAGLPLDILPTPLALLLLYHFGRLLKYFISNEFSVLHWFLYLCTVEILPVSFIFALIARVVE